LLRSMRLCVDSRLMAAQAFNIILASTTLVGFALAIWQSVRIEQVNRRRVDYSWPRLLSGIGHIVDDIHRSGFAPEIIVCLSDRASVIAYLIQKDLPTRAPVVTAVWDHKGKPPFTMAGCTRIGVDMEELPTRWSYGTQGCVGSRCGRLRAVRPNHERRRISTETMGFPGISHPHRSNRDEQGRGVDWK